MGQSTVAIANDCQQFLVRLICHKVYGIAVSIAG